MAMTADGKIDTVARQGARISGPADSARVDRLRASADAILVGGHTLLGEDPRLTVRDPDLVADRVRDGRPPQPAKVGIVSHLAVDGPHALRPDGAFLRDGGGRVYLCTTTRTSAETVGRLERTGATVIVAGDQRVDLGAALTDLAEHGVERLMVEGGSTIAAALYEGGFVDELQLAVAPLLFGGETAPTPVGGLGWSRDAAVQLALEDVRANDEGDVVLRYRSVAQPVGAP
jgi:2,5-diamino-6-(ribosylamino)-4(3H)-pyrimidinone 5'-phosphate reductase